MFGVRLLNPLKLKGLQSCSHNAFTTFQDSGQNAWVLLFPTVLGDKASDIKAFGLSHKSFQTRFRLSQTTETGDETGVFLNELGMK